MSELPSTPLGQRLWIYLRFQLRQRRITAYNYGKEAIENFL
jgi:hypothetical protein